MSCTRRVALQTIGAGAVGCLMAGACGGDEAGVPEGKATMCGTDLCLSLAENPDLAVVGGALYFPQVAAARLFVLRVSDTELRAVSAVCTHAGCVVAWDGDAFDCPCHGSRFTAAGAVMRGPAGTPLRTYPTTLNGDQLTIAL